MGVEGIRILRLPEGGAVAESSKEGLDTVVSFDSRHENGTYIMLLTL